MHDFEVVSRRELSSLDNCIKAMSLQMLPPHIVRQMAQYLGVSDKLGGYTFLRRTMEFWPGSVVMSDVSINDHQLGNNYSLDFLEKIPESEFVTAAYLLVLDRYPEPEGVKHWSTRMAEGLSRLDIIDNLRNSDEAKSRSTEIAASTGEWMKAKAGYENVYFKRNLIIPEGIFTTSEMNGESSHHDICIAVREAGGQLVLGPGMNLSGRVNSSGDIIAVGQWLLWGPRISLEKGQYVLEVKIACYTCKFFRIDVSSNAGQKIHAQININQVFNGNVYFESDTDLKGVEFRVLLATGEKNIVSIDKILLKKYVESSANIGY